MAFIIMEARFAGNKISGGVYNPAVGTGSILVDLIMGNGDTLGYFMVLSCWAQ